MTESGNNEKMERGPVIKATVVNIKGACDAGHKVGDEFILTLHTPEGLCVDACVNIIIKLRNMLFKKHEFFKDKNKKIRVNCPDLQNYVEFELERIENLDK